MKLSCRVNIIKPPPVHCIQLKKALPPDHEVAITHPAARPAACPAAEAITFIVQKKH